MSQQSTSCSDQRWPALAVALATLALAVTPMQFAVSVGPMHVTVADAVMAVAFAVVLGCAWKRTMVVRLPGLAFAYLLALIIANFATASGRGGAAEILQNVEFFFCGIVVFQVVLASQPRWAALAVSAGLLVNVLVALGQLLLYSSGPAVTGLMGSRMAFGTYAALALPWCMPYWWQWLRTRRPRLPLLTAATAVVLLVISHGQALVLASVAGIGGAWLTARRAALAAAIAAGLAGALLISPVGQSSRRSLSPYVGERLRQSHVELIAASRMGWENPLTGVGSGRYQTQVGTYYRELFNPSVNEIETDTQAGFGILLGSIGLPGTICLIGLLGWAAVVGLRQRPRLVARASAALLLTALAALLVTNPLVRGVGWMPILALAAIGAGGSAGWRQGFCRLSWRGLVAWSSFFLGAALLVALRQPPGPNQLTTVSTVEMPAWLLEERFFAVLEADAATAVHAPMQLSADPANAARQILRLPDNSCAIPADREPTLEHGAAEFVFTASEAMQVKIWLRVWWEGSCANSAYVKLNQTKAVAVGNDGTYNSWHWVALPASVGLTAGEQRLTVLNREDGIRIAQIVITDDQHYVPQGWEQRPQ